MSQSRRRHSSLAPTSGLAPTPCPVKPSLAGLCGVRLGPRGSPLYRTLPHAPCLRACPFNRHAQMRDPLSHIPRSHWQTVRRRPSSLPWETARQRGQFPDLLNSNKTTWTAVLPKTLKNIKLNRTQNGYTVASVKLKFKVTFLLSSANLPSSCLRVLFGNWHHPQDRTKEAGSKYSIPVETG